MVARIYGQKIAIKRQGTRLGFNEERVVFQLPSVTHCPTAVGFVNYRGAVYAVYKDADGLFLEQTDKPIPWGRPLGSWPRDR